MKYCSVCGGGVGPSKLFGRSEDKEERRQRKIQEGIARRDHAVAFFKRQDAKQKKFLRELPPSIKEQYLREVSIKKSPKKSPRKSPSSPRKYYSQ